MKSKKNKGISLISLTVAVCILIVVSAMLLYNAKNGVKIRQLKMMQNDIALLDDTVNSYYTKYGALPAEIEYLGGIKFDPQANDNNKYYVIDLKALEGITLNYGSDYNNITLDPNNSGDYDDVYIINEQSHHIYYARGIDMDGVMYYTNEEDEEINLQSISRVDITVDNLTYEKIGTEYKITLENVKYNKSYSVSYKEANDSSYTKKGTNIRENYYTFNVDKYGLYYIEIEDKAGKTKQLITSIYAGITTSKDEGENLTMVKAISGSNVETANVHLPKGFTISGVDGECPQTTLGVSTENEKSGTIDDGVVIYIMKDADGDGIIDTPDWNDPDMMQRTYDQFVWVPVPNAIATDKNGDGTIDETDIDLMIADEEYPMAIATDSTNYRGILYDFTLTDGKIVVSDKALSSTSTLYREPAYLTDSGDADASSYNNVGITESSLQEEFNTMVNRVLNKKGFWVGRYETSNMVGTASTSESNGLNKATVEADSTNRITVIKGTTTGISYDSSIPNYINWYRMYAQQKNYSNLASITATSSMIWGSQWDQIMIWMKEVKNETSYAGTNPFYVINSQGMGNFGTSAGGTGSIANTGYYSVKNIYDLAGNVYDWTLEACDTFQRSSA